jgi:hypothetical protein
LRENPEKYQKKSKFFRAKLFNIAGLSLSLDDIEHGILRRSRMKYALGYLGKMFPPKWEKQLRVDRIDHRIHFALNCGAKSCPPILFYQKDRLNQQLNLAESVYLSGSVIYDEAKKEVYVPAILSWFRADFGGKEGTRVLLYKYGLVPEGTKPRIKFSNYDWTLYLENFKQT